MVLLCTANGLAQKMELADDIVKIYGLGQQINGDTYFKINGNLKMPNKVRITEISLTYSHKSKDALLLSIVEVGGDTLFASDVKNGMTPEELRKSPWLYLSCGKNYIIAHGDKEWNVSFAEKKDNGGGTVSSKTLYGNKGEGESSNTIDNTKSISHWWVNLIVALVLGCVYPILHKFNVLSKFSEVLFRKNKKKDNSKQQENGFGGNSSNPIGGNALDLEISELKKKEDANDESELVALKSKISSLLQRDSEVELSDDDKINRIKSLLESGQKAKDELYSVRHALHIEDENASICESIGALKNRLYSEEIKKTQSEVCGILIEKLKDKNNKILSNIVNKAIEEKGSNVYEIVLKVVDLVSCELKEDKSNYVSAGQIVKITNDQLKNANNTYVLREWLSEQFEKADIQGFNLNIDVVDNLARLKERLDNPQRETSHKSEEEIIDGIISEGKLSEKQKNAMLRKLIDIVNGRIGDDSKAISDILSIDEFARLIAELITHEEANETSGSDVISSSKDASKDVEGNIEKLLQEYNATKLEDLPDAIREKQKEDIIKSVSGKISEYLPEQHVDSIQKLVNVLFKEVEAIKDDIEKIADEFEEKISSIDETYISNGGNRNVIELVGRYVDLIDKANGGLKEQITDKDRKISKLEGIISTIEQKVELLVRKNNSLMTEAPKLVEDLNSGVERILESCKTIILLPCSANEEQQCRDIEMRLFDDLKSFADRMKSFTVNEDTVPSDVRKSIQMLLIKEVSAENSVLNTVCRYYAYSRLPFMADAAREYGARFNRKNMSELYNAIEKLYVRFGINFDIPPLFTIGIDEGEFEDVTGRVYGDLDNLCPNSRNHVNKIDSNTKPSRIIVDVVNVGCFVDGQVHSKTSVLTF